MKTSMKLWLFLGSYAPLFILLALLEWSNAIFGITNLWLLKPSWLSIMFLALAIIGVVATIAFVSIAKTISPTSITPKVIDSHAQETLAYLVTYLIPFIGFQFIDTPSVIANGLLFLIIGFLYVQSNMIYLNPTLSLMGYRVYRITVNDKEKLMLAKSIVKTDTRQRVVAISEGIYIGTNK